MFTRKQNNGVTSHTTITQACDFELSIVDMQKRSERRAWWVASAAITMAIVLAAGYLFVMPLKEQVPYLVLADPYRGTSTVARIESLSPAYTANEFLNKSHVANFVIARESYDWDLTAQRDKRLVYSMATASALAEYRELLQPNHPENPDNLYGQGNAIRVKILSVVLHNNSANQQAESATVRFERWLFNRASGQSKLLDTRLATLKIGYDSALQMNEEGRYLNPLGFRVTAYRTDPDAMGLATSAQPPLANTSGAAQ